MVELNDIPEETIRNRAQRLELLLLDVDGVLTDGSIILIGEDDETKRFDVQDGMGITLAQEAGIEVGIVTGRVSDVVRRRAEELGIERVYQGYDWKVEALEEIRETTDLSTEKMAFIGDDVLDLAIMSEVGLSLSPGNAHSSVRDRCDLKLDQPGGQGAIRECVDYLLAIRGEKTALYKYFSQGAYDSSSTT